MTRPPENTVSRSPEDTASRPPQRRAAPRRLRPTSLLLAGWLALVGCATIPTSGPVRVGEDLRSDGADSVVRVLPPLPRSGATPEEIVRGFLLASAALEIDHGSARQYLASAVRARWQPAQGVRVYDSDTFDLQANGPVVTVAVEQVARITAEGRYQPLPAPTELTSTFRLSRTSGQWRIEDLPDGLLLTTFDVRRIYRQVAVYFLDPQRSILVPDLLLVANRPPMATALVTRLLDGPSRWLAPAVESALPAGTTLAVPSVPVVDGVAQVDLDTVALTASPVDRQALSAQLVWTLGQLPEVRAVHLSVDGQEYDVPAAASVQPRGAWETYDPDGQIEAPVPYIVRDGALGSLDGGIFTPVAGALGTGEPAVEDPALARGATAVAGLVDGRRTLVTGPLGASSAPAPVLTGTDLAPPSFDRTGGLWTVDRVGRGRLLVVAADGRVEQIPVHRLGRRVLHQVVPSRDGTRVAAVARRPGGRDELLVGVVRPGPPGRGPVAVGGLSPVAPELSSVQDVAWVDASRLAVAGQAREAMPAPVVIDADGYTVSLTAPVDAVEIAAAPDSSPLLVATPVGQVYASSGRSWSLVGVGTDPTYPG